MQKYKKFIRDNYKEQYVTKMENLQETSKFLEKYNLQKLNQEEIENMNTITSTEIKTIIKTLQQQKPRARWLHGEFYQKFREQQTPILLTLPENCRGRKSPKLIIWGHHHCNTKHKGTTKNKNYRTISLMNIDTPHFLKHLVLHIINFSSIPDVTINNTQIS